jgi:hypothetical protein
MSDLTTEDRALLARIAREQAVKAVSAAIGAVLDYADYVRQEAECRLGVPAGDMAVSGDEAYRKILDVYVDLGDAKRKLGEVAG